MTVVPLPVQRFIEYLRIKTVQPTPDYESCTAFLKQQAEELGLAFSAHSYVAGKPVVVLTWEGTQPDLPTIVLNSHTDVVPVAEDQWTQDPFGGARVAVDGDHRIYARGAQDMKIVGMAYLEAVRVLQAQGRRLRRTLHLVYVPDEEIGGHDGMALFVESPEFKSLNAGFALDEGMANPEDAVRVFYGERAPCWVTFEATGAAGHGSRFVQDTATEKLARLVTLLMDYRASQERLLDAPRSDGSSRTLGDVTSANLTMLSAGVQHNVVPDRASAGFDFRMTPTEDYAGFRAWLERLAAENGASVDFVQFWEDATMTDTTPANPFWAAFESTLGQLQVPFVREIFPAATDSRYLRRAGVPALGVTPLRRAPILLHDHDEYVTENEFLAAIDFYAAVVAALADVA
ncbi:adenylate cyclase [Coemansia sp. Benny D115]|nr:adenylate cyclase [Coemansia sp. Benny D115]